MHKFNKDNVEFIVQGVREDNGRTKFEDIPDDGQIDGAQLTEEESHHLLPHFLMLVVGRPGSGKSYTVKQLV
jgi:type II secretory ATPase GspE/PulE/Tfp pilus assembly ATPase PilB-like protein